MNDIRYLKIHSCARFVIFKDVDDTHYSFALEIIGCMSHDWIRASEAFTTLETDIEEAIEELEPWVGIVMLAASAAVKTEDNAI